MNTEPRMALKVEFLSNENETLNGMFSIEERYEDVVRKAQWLINSNPLFLYRVLIPSSNFQWKWLIETNIGFFLVTGGKEPEAFNKGLLWGCLEFTKNAWSNGVAGAAEILTSPLVGLSEKLQKHILDSDTSKKQKRKY